MLKIKFKKGFKSNEFKIKTNQEILFNIENFLFIKKISIQNKFKIKSNQIKFETRSNQMKFETLNDKNKNKKNLIK